MNTVLFEDEYYTHTEIEMIVDGTKHQLTMIVKNDQLGIAGIGSTIIEAKSNLDYALELANQDTEFVTTISIPYELKFQFRNRISGGLEDIDDNINIIE